MRSHSGVAWRIACAILSVSSILAVVAWGPTRLETVAAAQPEKKPQKVEVSFGKSYVPKGLKAGEKVHVKKVLSARINGKGGLTIESQELLRDIEVADVTVVEKPANPQEAVKVALLLNEEQAGKLDGLGKGFPPLQLVRKNPAKEAVKKPDLTPQALELWGHADAVFVARLSKAEAIARTPEQPALRHVLHLEVDHVVLGRPKKGDRIEATHTLKRGDNLKFPTGKDCIVALKKSGDAWTVQSVQESNAKDLVQAELACAVPVGWSLRDGWLVSPWADLGDDAWPLTQIPKTQLACAETGRPALLAGAGIELKAEPVPPKEKVEGKNPDGDGEFRVTVKNVTDKAVEVPALLFDGKKILWAESLVLVSPGDPNGLLGGTGAKLALPRALVTHDARVGRQAVEPTVLQPGEEVSGVVNILKVPGVLPQFGSKRTDFEFALGERRVGASFYYHSSYHRGLRKKLRLDNAAPDKN